MHSGQVGRCGLCESETVVSNPREMEGVKGGDKEGRAHVSCFSLFLESYLELSTDRSA